MRLAIACDEGKEFVVAGALNFVPRIDSVQTVVYSSDALAIYRAAVPVEVAVSILRSVTGEDVSWDLPGYRSVEAHGYPSRLRLIGALDDKTWVQTRWPAEFIDAAFTVDQQLQQHLQYNSNHVRFQGSGRIYPNAMTAMYQELFDIVRIQSAYNCIGHFHVALPDYRARITALKVDDTSVTAAIERGPWYPAGGLFAEVFVESDSGPVQERLDVPAGEIRIDARARVRHVVMHVVDDVGQVMDEFERRYDLPFVASPYHELHALPESYLVYEPYASTPSARQREPSEATQDKPSDPGSDSLASTKQGSASESVGAPRQAAASSSSTTSTVRIDHGIRAKPAARTARTDPAEPAADDDPDRVFLLADTNFFVHGVWIESLRLSEFGARRVTLVITSTTIAELDEIKRAPNKTDRIRNRISKLQRWLDVNRTASRTLPGAPVKKGLDLFRYSTPPAAHPGLDIVHSKDDRIIAQALSLQKIIPSLRFMSDDTGPRLTADDLGLPVLQVPSKLMLPREPDPKDRQIKQLEAALTKAQADLTGRLDAERPRFSVEPSGGSRAGAAVSQEFRVSHLGGDSVDHVELLFHLDGELHGTPQQVATVALQRFHLTFDAELPTSGEVHTLEILVRYWWRNQECSEHHRWSFVRRGGSGAWELGPKFLRVDWHYGNTGST